MNLDRIPLDRRRFLIIGGASALVAACSSGNGADTSDATGGTGNSSTTKTAATQPTTSTSSSPSSTSPSSTADPTSTAPRATAPAETTTPTDPGDELTPLTAADFDALGVCALLAETTAGPFPTQDQLERRDVTEGYPGHPTRLGLRVIDAACDPVPGAVVEIWHADASGDYSEYRDGGEGKDEGEGTAFLRGHQVAGEDGIVEFHTIYPGWYRGRAVHVHLRVHVDGATVLTSQLFFDDAYSEQVYEHDPYAEFGNPDTSNDDDNIAGPAIATGGLLTVSTGPTAAGEGTVALTNLGVNV